MSTVTMKTSLLPKADRKNKLSNSSKTLLIQTLLESSNFRTGLTKKFYQEFVCYKLVQSSFIPTKSFIKTVNAS